MKKHQTKAFTLVELIIVITILAILATIGFMSYQSYTADTRDSSRITSLKTVYDGLTISYVKKQTYPTPDDYIDIVGVSKQGYVGDIITKSIRGDSFKDPKDNTRFLYSLDYTGKKIQLSGFLENNNKLLLSQNNTFLNQAFAGNIDYTSRYIYTIGDRVGILLDSSTNAPVTERISTGTLDLNTDTSNYTVVFSNNTTNSGTISGSGQALLTNISIIQNSCVLGNTVVTSGGQISAYNTNTVAYNQTCTPISRTCNNGILSGDTNYKYDICSPANALNCTRTTYNGYSVPAINHGITQTISKAITGGTSSIDATCTNGALSYGTETTTCSTNYTLTGNSCVANTQTVTCGGTIPSNATAATPTTYTQTWNGTIWAPTTSWGASQSTCDFNCNTNYAWNGTSCVQIGSSSTNPGLSCLDILNKIPTSTSGNYWIKPDTAASFQVYCDMTTDGGGWTRVFYSNSASVPRTSIDGVNWNIGNTLSVNFSILYEMRNRKNNSGVYEFRLFNDAGIYNRFTQTNSYNTNPVGNSYTRKGGNFTFSWGSTWYGLATSNFGSATMRAYCSLATTYEGNSRRNCFQDQDAASFGAGPWQYAYTSQAWVQIYQK
ncbi:MAG: fibrinogen-like YCDxxxxGGGW domain-containing protein [Candidatus Gracilibacteria bacterium]|nr:fibrinogen-like YCDxxxxGGGW domain-containing protein [Candidatus Gracilibacteria bacterium]